MVLGARRARGARARARARRRAPLDDAEAQATGIGEDVLAGNCRQLHGLAHDGRRGAARPALGARRRARAGRAGERGAHDLRRAARRRRAARELARGGRRRAGRRGRDEPPERPRDRRGVPRRRRGRRRRRAAQPGLHGDEFHAYLEDLQPRAMLFLRGEESAGARGLRGARRAADRARGRHDGELALDGIAATGAPPARDPEAVALLLHTSGTTSKPKGVPIRQRNLAASARAIAATYGLSGERREPLRDAALPRPRPRRLDARDARLGRQRDRAAPLLGERVLGRLRDATGRRGTRPCRRSTASCSRAPRTARASTPATGCASPAPARRRCPGR